MRIKSIFISLLAILSLSFSIPAQETEIQVVDEVIAQVNDSIITLSQVKNEIKNIVDSMVEQGKTREEAASLTENKRGQLIANLITEELLIQKGKELGMENSVEARLNQELLEFMKQLNLKSLDELYQAMRAQGVDPETWKAAKRKKIMQDLVWRSQVDEPLYFGPTEKELETYYNANKSKFTKPATVDISEIFLSFAGRDKEEVKKKAADIVAKARAGADFGQLAIENSDRPDVAENKGKVGKFNVPDIDPKFAKAIENVKAGEVADPIEMDIGMEILRVDARTKATSETYFDKNAVRTAILYEKAPEARKKYIKDLLEDSYVKIRDSYRALVMPHLNPESANSTTASN